MTAGWAVWTAVLVLGGLLVGIALGRRSRIPAATADDVASGVGQSIRTTDRRTGVLINVLERYPVGVVVADPDGSVVFRNAAVRSYDGTHVAALLDAAVRRRLADELSNSTPSGPLASSPEPGELVELYGPPRRLMSVTTERLADGTAVAFVEDVTESDRLDRVRTDFVANVSHELKTPIGALTLLAEALADETDEAVRERLIARMEIEADRAGKTIDHLVELSEIESSPTIDPSLVTVGDLVDASADRVLELARHRSVTIEANVTPDTARRVLVGHRPQLESALGNLVENAVAYSPPKSVVTIDAVVESSTGSSDTELLEVSVVDHGVGIPKDQQDRIFERFYRVDRARSRETGGTGLGLSIVKRAAIAHRGSVSVTSVEGEGSTFVLRLPLAPAAADGSKESE